MGDMADFINDERGDEWADDAKLETIPIEEVVRETEKAYLVKLKEGNRASEHWFPKSQCNLAADKKSIEVPGWLLDSKGIV